MPVLFRHLFGGSQRSAPGNDGYLAQGICFRNQQGGKGMTGFMIGDHLFFLVGKPVFALDPHHDFIPAFMEIFHFHLFFAFSGREQGCLVDQVF